MAERSGYQIVPPEDVRPGDLYKFQPVGNLPPIYATVLSVDHGLVEIERDGQVRWTYIQPVVGVVTFGRVVKL